MKHAPLALAAVLALGAGCASISKPKVASVTVKVPKACSGQVNCTITNKKEQREVVPPGQIVIKKSDDPLRVACTDESGKLYHSNEVAGTRTGRAWGNLVLGGGVGAIIDANTDAHWEYPETIEVPCP